MKYDIIGGYKGVMDLDLNLVDPRFHEIAVKQHYQDITQYKIEQSKLKPELRYENTVQRVLKQLDKEQTILRKRKQIETK